MCRLRNLVGSVAGWLLALASTTNAAVVDFQLTALPAPSATDTAVMVPVSQPNFALGSTIFLEVWVRTIQANGLSSASLDIAFDSALVTATTVTHSAVFSTLTHSVINNFSGAIDDLSGSHLGPCTDAVGVTPNWARVAVIEFTVDASGPMMIAPTSTGSMVYGTAVCGVGDVDPAQIEHAGVTVFLGDATIPAVSDWGLAVLILLLLSAGTVMIRRMPRYRLTA